MELNPINIELLLRVIDKTQKTLELYHKLEQQQGLEDSEEVKQQLKELLNIPTVDSLLLDAIEDIYHNLTKASILAKKHKLEEIDNQIKSVIRSK